MKYFQSDLSIPAVKNRLSDIKTQYDFGVHLLSQYEEERDDAVGRGDQTRAKYWRNKVSHQKNVLRDRYRDIFVAK